MQSHQAESAQQQDEDGHRSDGGEREDDDHEWGEEFDEAQLPDTFTTIPEELKTKGKGRNRRPRKEGAASRSRWTKEQDDVLREKFPLYQDTHSVYDLLALEPALEVNYVQPQTRIR